MKKKRRRAAQMRISLSAWMALMPAEGPLFQPEEHCRSCCYWRLVRGSRWLRLCHYSEDTGRTRLRRGPEGETVYPQVPCPYRRVDPLYQPPSFQAARGNDHLFSGKGERARL